MKPQFYDIGRRRELFIDESLTEKVRGDISRRLHEPIPHEPDPTAPLGKYQTVIFDRGLLRRYYQSNFADYTRSTSMERYIVKPGFIGEFTGYAESRDGFRWMKPEAMIYDSGVPNVIFCKSPKYLTHNFTPFLDVNPGCAAEERFKALAGTSDSGGVFAMSSPDGVHWTVKDKNPVLTSPGPRFKYLFDSQNVSFYSVAEGRYVCYFRVNCTKDNRALRSIARMDSSDYIHWENFQELDVNRENENLYVSQIQPYFRAPHIYVGTPTRYYDERNSATDIAICFSRGGGPILRPWPGAWIRPGLNPESWGNRYNYLAYGIIPTSENEMSLFHTSNGVRYTLRYDGFVSLSSVNGGEWLSKVLRYTSGTLEMNISTTAGGLAVVELRNPDDTPIPGFEFENCEPMYGDTIAWKPCWKGNGVLKEGTFLRIACRLREADIYSFAFTGNEPIAQILSSTAQLASPPQKEKNSSPCKKKQKKTKGTK